MYPVLLNCNIGCMIKDARLIKREEHHLYRICVHVLLHPAGDERLSQRWPPAADLVPVDARSALGDRRAVEPGHLQDLLRLRGRIAVC